MASTGSDGLYAPTTETHLLYTCLYSTAHSSHLCSTPYGYDLEASKSFRGVEGLGPLESVGIALRLFQRLELISKQTLQESPPVSFDFPFQVTSLCRLPETTPIGVNPLAVFERTNCPNQRACHPPVRDKLGFWRSGILAPRQCSICFRRGSCGAWVTSRGWFPILFSHRSFQKPAISPGLSVVF